ncbi:hypothetical protein C8R46DRAFT_1030536 [Mycena filopes]|nr:hypothetical protein C8R46DRAFT_1030536 [Mycena filopes]
MVFKGEYRTQTRRCRPAKRMRTDDEMSSMANSLGRLRRELAALLASERCLSAYCSNVTSLSRKQAGLGRQEAESSKSPLASANAVAQGENAWIRFRLGVSTLWGDPGGIGVRGMCSGGVMAWGRRRGYEAPEMGSNPVQADCKYSCSDGWIRLVVPANPVEVGKTNFGSESGGTSNCDDSALGGCSWAGGSASFEIADGWSTARPSGAWLGDIEEAERVLGTSEPGIAGGCCEINDASPSSIALVNCDNHLGTNLTITNWPVHLHPQSGEASGGGSKTRTSGPYANEEDACSETAEPCREMQVPFAPLWDVIVPLNGAAGSVDGCAVTPDRGGTTSKGSFFPSLTSLKLNDAGPRVGMGNVRVAE